MSVNSRINDQLARYNDCSNAGITHFKRMKRLKKEIEDWPIPCTSAEEFYGLAMKWNEASETMFYIATDVVKQGALGQEIMDLLLELITILPEEAIDGDN